MTTASGWNADTAGLRQHGRKAPQGDIPEELNRNLRQVLAEVIQRVKEYEVAALGAALTPARVAVPVRIEILSRRAD